MAITLGHEHIGVCALANGRHRRDYSGIRSGKETASQLARGETAYVFRFGLFAFLITAAPGVELERSATFYAPTN
jgi:hypothetical protein